MEGDALVAVISRTRLIQYLYQHLGAIAEIAQFTVAEAGLDEAFSLHACKPDTEVGSAYALMLEKDVTCLPVINANGHLVGTISQSDLKGRDVKDLIVGFNAPVGTYVEKFAHSRVVGGAFPSTCTKADTLAHVLRKLADSRLHQLFVVDGEKVIAALSLGDLLKTLRDAL